MATRFIHLTDHFLFSGALVLALLAVLAIPGQTLSAQEAGADEDVTYTRDIAPIIQQNCQICHRPASVAPMSFMEYRDVRRYARRIKDQVARRLMPPYHYDAGNGIQDLKNDWRLSEEEIGAIVTWVDNGTPEGDLADMPEAMVWRDEQMWQQEDRLGPPDHVIKTFPFDVPAEGGDMWWRPVVPTEMTSERWIRAMEVRPSFPAGRQVVHHANPKLLRLKDDGDYQPLGNLSEYAMGKVGEIVPEDAARLIKPGDKIEWDTHYYPMGFEVPGDQIELGIWFYPEGYEPEFTQNLRLYPLSGDIFLEPGGTSMTQGFYRWDHPVRIDSFQPHGHVHLHGMSIKAIYPDGRQEVLSMVSDFDARWHHSYIFDDDKSPLLPAGTVLVMTGWYENTADNPLTDSEMFYARGSRTVDEMSHAWIAVSHLDDEGLERIKAEREAKSKVTSDDGAGSN